MWELDDDDLGMLTTLTSSRIKRPSSGCLSEDIIKSIVDPDDITDAVKPSVLRKQSRAFKAIEPLTTVISCHLEPFIAHARSVVWNLLNSGGADVRQARKRAVIWGWDEIIFLSVFEKLRVQPGPATVQRRAALTPPMQPASYEGAWASKRKRSIQLLAVAGSALDDWCSFQDFRASSSRFYAGAGYKEVSAKLIVELAAILTVDTKRPIGRQSQITLFVTTISINSQRAILSCPCRWHTNHPIDYGVAVQEHAQDFYQKMCELSTVPSDTAQSANATSTPHSLSVSSTVGMDTAHMEADLYTSTSSPAAVVGQLDFSEDEVD